jgi:hypothetical protein
MWRAPPERTASLSGPLREPEEILENTATHALELLLDTLRGV